MIRRSRGRSVAGGGLLTVTLMVAALGISAVAGSDRPGFEKNSNGQTLGSALDASSPSDEPDLIAAEASNGQRGYVKKSELDQATGATIASPDEALVYQQAIDRAIAAGRTVATIAVYAKDGLTVIGTFEIPLGDR